MAPRKANFIAYVNLFCILRFVKAGTLCKLVEALASSDTGEIESTYVNVFLATYRTFASPKQVLNLLIER